MSLGEADLGRRGSSSSSRGSSEETPPLAYRLANGLAQGVLLLLVLVTPWCFGGVYASTQVYCQAGIALALVVWVCLLPGRQYGNDSLPLCLAPLLLALAIPAIQLIPLGEGTLALLSPRAASLRKELQVPPAANVALPTTVVDKEVLQGSTLPTAAPLSMYPAGTRRRAALLSMAVAAFALGFRFFRRREPLLLLLAATTACGAALAFYGILQKLSSSRMIYGIYPLLDGGNPFGPYINRNNAAGFLNIALGCSIGLLAWHLTRRTYRSADSAGLFDDDQGTSAVKRIGQQLGDFVGNLTALRLTLLAAPILIVAGECASLSRGGIAAMTLGLGAACWAMKRLRNSWLPAIGLAVVIVAAIGLLGFAGLKGEFENRLESMVTGGISDNTGRSELFKTQWQTLANYWLCGSGLGTFRFVHQPYGDQFRAAMFEYAENQYAEAWAEGGLLGFALLLAATVLTGRGCLRLVRTAQRNYEQIWSSVMLVVLFVTQGVQALFDFGLYYPGNFLPFALICGSCAGRVAMIDSQIASKAKWAVLPGSRWLAPVVALLLTVLTCWSWRETSDVAAVEQKTFNPRWPNTPTAVGLPEIEAQIERLTAAIDRRPDDTIGHNRLGHLWLRRFRLLALAELKREQPDKTDAELWPFTDIGALHALAVQMQTSGRQTELAQLRAEPTVVNNLGPAWRHFCAARDACPMFAEPQSYLAAMCFLVGDPLRDEKYLDAVVTIAPHHADLMMFVGMLDFDAGRQARGLKRIRSAWESSPQLADDIMPSLGKRLSFETMFDELFPRNPDYLIRIAKQHYAGPEDRAKRVALGERALKLIEDAPAGEFDKTTLLRLKADAAAQAERLPMAVDFYRLFLLAHPGDLQVRLNLIGQLERAKRNDEAIAEAKTGLQINPHAAEFDQIIRRLAPNRGAEQ